MQQVCFFSAVYCKTSDRLPCSFAKDDLQNVQKTFLRPLFFLLKKEILLQINSQVTLTVWHF
jgi:hypothetical protein